MKYLLLSISVAALMSGLAEHAWSLDRPHKYPQTKLAQARECPQVIHCGIKDKKAKQYPTKCAAEDDGATNIQPKGAGPCPEIE